MSEPKDDALNEAVGEQEQLAQDVADQAVEEAAEAAGFGDLECHTWAGWQALGRMVIHTSEAVFKVEVSDPTTKKGTRIKSFFTYSQTQPVPMV